MLLGSLCGLRIQDALPEEIPADRKKRRHWVQTVSISLARPSVLQAARGRAERIERERRYVRHRRTIRLARAMLGPTLRRPCRAQARNGRHPGVGPQAYDAGNNTWHATSTPTTRRITKCDISTLHRARNEAVTPEAVTPEGQGWCMQQKPSRRTGAVRSAWRPTSGRAHLGRRERPLWQAAQIVYGPARGADMHSPPVSSGNSRLRHCSSPAGDTQDPPISGVRPPSKVPFEVVPPSALADTAVDAEQQ